MGSEATGVGVSCTSCAACCCRLEVLLMPDDSIPSRFTVEDAWDGRVMRRLDDGWCAALDRETMRCTIYARRPTICRDFAVGDFDCLAQRARWLPGFSAAVPRDGGQGDPDDHGGDGRDGGAGDGAVDSAESERRVMRADANVRR